LPRRCRAMRPCRRLIDRAIHIWLSQNKLVLCPRRDQNLARPDARTFQSLACLYGMEAESLASRIGRLPIVARDLLRTHRETYRAFWRWSDAAVDHAMLAGELHTAFGWHVHVGDKVNPRSLRNFPMQANGAEMLRLACCFAVESAIEVCAPVHDAVLIGAPIDRLDADIERMRDCMARASRAVLGGFELRADAAPVLHPDRYRDPRGVVMWDRVTGLLKARQTKRAAA
jgi:DNA polymerase I